jgi:hypothetical protein
MAAACGADMIRLNPGMAGRRRRRHRGTRIDDVLD